MPSQASSRDLVFGAIVGLPMVTISIAIGGSDREPILSILWLLALFLAWAWQ